MTKKDFIAIANILNVNGAPEFLVQDFADHFEKVNPRFNRALFIKESTKGLLLTAQGDVRRLTKIAEGA